MNSAHPLPCAPRRRVSPRPAVTLFPVKAGSVVPVGAFEPGDTPVSLRSMKQRLSLGVVLLPRLGRSLRGSGPFAG